MKKHNIIESNRGFTLVELLVALLISGMLMATVASVFLMSQKVYTRGSDISYKQKNITNVETDLQNALARATVVKIAILPSDNSTDKSYLNLGFNASGECVEYIDGTEYIVDQISEINLETLPKGGLYSLKYELKPKKDSGMSTLKGGIIMNNIKTNPFSSESLNDEDENYLVIEYKLTSP